MLYPILYGRAQTVYFPLITAGGTAFQPTWTPGAGEYDYVLDGGAVTTLGSAPSHEGNGIWSQALTVNETSGDILVLSYSDSTTDIEDQAIICDTRFTGQLEANQGIFVLECDTATFTPTSASAEFFAISPITTEEATADHFKNGIIMGTSGALRGQKKDITASVLANSKIKLTWTAMTEAPADGDYMVVL